MMMIMTMPARRGLNVSSIFENDDDNGIDEERFGRMPRLFSKILFLSENWKSDEKKKKI